MFRHLARVAVIVAVSGIALMGIASAQTARRTLSQRLEQFRDDLVGDGSADDGSQDPGLPSPAVQKPVPTPAAASSGATPKTAGVPTLAGRPKAVGDSVNSLKVQGSRGSSRRTAQPGYKSGKSQPTPADADSSQPDAADSADPPPQEPTLAKRPETPRRVEAEASPSPRSRAAFAPTRLRRPMRNRL